MKEIIYYTCNTHKDDIEQVCRKQLLKAGLPIVSVSLNKDINFGNTKIVMNGKRSPEMMHKQVLAGLKASQANYVFLCESDVLYHSSHFDFRPPRKDTFFYNTNVWKIRYPDGFATWVDNCQQVSGVCADRELAIAFYERRNSEIEEKGFDRCYEPHRRTGEIDDVWVSEYPNLCIRHDANLTGSKWSLSDFNNRHFAIGWKTANEVAPWGNTKFEALLGVI